MISDSKFNMWRTVFALAHVDGIVTDEERHFMKDTMEELLLSLDQKNTLIDDIQTPQDPVEMYKCVTDNKDCEMFFQFAKTMVWIDGTYDEDERLVMERLQALKHKGSTVAARVCHKSEEQQSATKEQNNKNDGETENTKPKNHLQNMIGSFQNIFATK